MSTRTAELPLPAAAEQRRTDEVRWLTIACLLAILIALYAARTVGLAPASVAHESKVAAPAGVITDFGRRPSHNRRYHAEVLSAGPESARVPQRWIVRLTGRNQRRVANAKVAVRAWMPETDAESPVHPTVRYIGRGEYQVDRVLFTRPGLWNVALVVEGRAGVDSLAFNVVLPE